MIKGKDFKFMVFIIKYNFRKGIINKIYNSKVK